MVNLQFSDMNVYLGIHLYVMSYLDPPCHTLSKKQKLPEGHGCELLQFKLPSTRKLHSCIAITLMDYLLLTYVKRLFQEAISFSRCVTVPVMYTVCNKISVILRHHHHDESVDFCFVKEIGLNCDLK